jgi:predicted AAA+ superfamily ATPase
MEISGKEVLTTRMSAKIKKEFTHYLNSGGFPEVLKFGKAILRSIYEDVIYKDIISRYKIRKTRSFKELVRVLASNYSKEFTYTKLKKVIRLKDIETIKKFVDYLDSSYLFFVLEQFSYKLKRQMLAPKKIYSIDPGMIEIMAFKFSRDPGKVIENVVAIELQRQKCFDPDIEIFYWKNERGEEVDFVVKKGNAVHELIQVSYEVENPLTREREIKALLKGAIELRCKHLKIITDDYEDEEQHKDLKIIFIPLWKWLLAPLG